MAKLNVNKWQASRRGPRYTPVMQMYLRQIRMAMFEALRVKAMACPYVDEFWTNPPSPQFKSMNWAGNLWDAAIMARDWIARPAPLPSVDLHGYLLSFDGACEALGLNADHERVWMLAKIDEAADFDTDEVYARIAYLTANPPDEQEDELYPEAPRNPVKALDQGCLFGMGAAA